MYVHFQVQAVSKDNKNKCQKVFLPLRPPKACSRPWTSLVPLGEVETTILGVSEVPGFVVASGSRGEWLSLPASPRPDSWRPSPSFPCQPGLLVVPEPGLNVLDSVEPPGLVDPNPVCPPTAVKPKQTIQILPNCIFNSQTSVTIPDISCLDSFSRFPDLTLWQLKGRQSGDCRHFRISWQTWLENVFQERQYWTVTSNFNAKSAERFKTIQQNSIKGL